jgi:hypothetical protein
MLQALSQISCIGGGEVFIRCRGHGGRAVHWVDEDEVCCVGEDEDGDD